MKKLPLISFMEKIVLTIFHLHFFLEEEEDPDKEVKELINKRLTSCMLLALSFESEDSYPEDFYEKLKESAKLDEVTTPITKEELKILNNLLKEKKPEAKKRVKRAGKNKDAAKSPKK